MNQLLEAFRLVAQPEVVIAILVSSVYGLVVGSLPGLSATMATALLVPFTFGARPRLAVPVALLAPIVVHLVFYKLLRVPLPAGLIPMPW